MNVELMAPAGGAEALKAAVQNGADAVYFGGATFNARAGAENFLSIEEAVEYCHLRGVRAYLTTNTLVREEEFPRLNDLLWEAAQAGVDALIVQDLAVAIRARRLVPGIPLHMSTQAGVLGEQGARFALQHGFERVVAARECTLADLKAMADTGMEVEAFVQGALCVCYSGRCLLSSMIGGRSGNRGRCAQPCRLPYRMAKEDGYLLSPRDLCLLAELPALIGAGVGALKIEGRMRRPEYVAIATAAYRRALDAALEGRAYHAPEDRAALSAVFTRGQYTRGWAFEETDAEFFYPERPNHSGVPVGSAKADGRVMLETPLHKGDALEYRPSGQGFQAQADAPSGLLRDARARAGDTLYRTGDAALLEAARQSYARERRATVVDAALTLRPGQPASLALGAERVEGEIVQLASKRPLTEADARKQMDRFGEEPLALGSFTLVGEDAFLPVSALNALRRSAVEAWKADRLDKARRYPIPSERLTADTMPKGSYAPPERPLLIAQSTDPAALRAMAGLAGALYYQPLDWREEPLRKAVESLPAKCHLVLPFWLDGPMLERVLSMARGRVAGFVAGSLAALQAAGEGCIGDYPLNAFSPLGAQALRDAGCARVTLSPELTLKQMATIARRLPGEAIVHGQLPLMTLRHCPVRASSGLGMEGRLRCDLCRGEPGPMIDRKNERFPLRRIRSEDGCRVELLNAHTLDMLDRLEGLKRAGLAAIRLLTDDIAAVKAYADALDDKEAHFAVARRTRGHYDRGVE